MSFPQTQAVIEAISQPITHPAQAAAATLLRQYQQLAQGLEAQAAEVPALQARLQAAEDRAAMIQSLREQEVQELTERVAILQATVDTMDAHPDVVAKKLAEAQRRRDAAQAEIDALTPKSAEVQPTK